MKKITLIIIFTFFTCATFAQTDSLNNNINGDPVDEYSYKTDFDNSNLQDIVINETKFRTQKLYKNIFLISFIFMIVFVCFMFFIYHSKIKEVLKLISIQEKELILKSFEIKKLGMILNNTEDAVSITDEKGSIIWNNSSFINVFGYSLEEIKQDSNFNIFVSSKNDVRELLNKCKTKKTAVLYSTNTTNKQGDEIWFQRKIMPVKNDDNNEVINFVVVDTDFTALKIAMKEKSN